MFFGDIKNDPGKTWTGVHKSGENASFKFYGALDFNKDAKVVTVDEYFDISGVLSSVMTKP